MMLQGRHLVEVHRHSVTDVLDGKEYGEAVTQDTIRPLKALENLGIIYLYHLQEPEKAGVYFRKYLTLVPDDPQKELILKAIQDVGS